MLNIHGDYKRKKNRNIYLFLLKKHARTEHFPRKKKTNLEAKNTYFHNVDIKMYDIQLKKETHLVAPMSLPLSWSNRVTIEKRSFFDDKNKGRQTGCLRVYIFACLNCEPRPKLKSTSEFL